MVSSGMKGSSFDPCSLPAECLSVPEHDIESPKAECGCECEQANASLMRVLPPSLFSPRISSSSSNGNSEAFLYVFHSEVLDFDISTSCLFLSN